MKPKSKKSVLILIIILMIIIIPSAIWGTINHVTLESEPVDNNQTKEFYHNGKLYFYNLNTLVGIYTCSSSVCDYAYETIDDDKYALNYHLVNSNIQVKMINNKYAFIVDTDGAIVPYTGSNIILYDIVNNRSVGSFKAVKNYNIGLENNQVLLQNSDGLWGVIGLNDTPSLVIPYLYNYIGVHDVLANNTTTLETDIYAVSDSSGWKLINKGNTNLTSYYSFPIYDYNSQYVILKNNNYYFLYNYQNTPVITFGYSKMMFMGEYVGVLNTSNQFYVIDPKTTADVSKRYNVTSMDDVTYTISETGLTISINGTVMETISSE